MTLLCIKLKINLLPASETVSQYWCAGYRVKNMKFESYCYWHYITKNYSKLAHTKQISLLIKKQGKQFVQIPTAIYTTRDS